VRRRQWLSSSQRRRVVITGMDAHFGPDSDLAQIVLSLWSGTPGIAVDEERQRLGFRSPLAGRLPPLDGSAFFDRKTRKTRKSISETALFAAVTARRAIAASGCGELLSKTRTGIIYDNDSSAEPLASVVDAVRNDHATTFLGSSKVIQALTSTATINLGPLLQTKGISLTVSGACSSGAHAIGLAWRMIASGMQDRIICGGTQETCWESIPACDAIRVSSMRLEGPAGAVRPFSADRDGLVPSGGAASLVLEDRDTALARGAPILAEVIGYAFGSGSRFYQRARDNQS
jgi:3-oxoacyl-[acyl-carrier-protein] synthase-1